MDFGGNGAGDGTRCMKLNCVAYNQSGFSEMRNGSMFCT